MKIGKYSFGIGDRFGMQGYYQLKALMKMAEEGTEFTPVWNKSNREHNLVHTEPSDVRKEADEAVKKAGYKSQYLVDADHINLGNVDRFVEPSDFFTIDVADYIGKKADDEEIKNFIEYNKKYMGKLEIPGIKDPFTIDEKILGKIADNYLYATREASKIFRYIRDKKGEGKFIPEVSMDEVNVPQTPVEMFFILSALSFYRVPVQTIAPKFSGRFNKGVDYEGDISRFSQEFEEDLLVIDHAVREFGLPQTLKLSVHSGSDKFSIYPVMGKLIKKHDKGIHIKTAGTTWLEEVIGLALSGGEALELAKTIYYKGFEHKEEYCQPYATVIDIDYNKLPSPQTVKNWSADKYADTLRHIPGNKDYNPNFRQLIHVSYKVAAELSDEYKRLVKANAELVGKQVYENLYERHLKRLF